MLALSRMNLCRILSRIIYKPEPVVLQLNNPPTLMTVVRGMYTDIFLLTWGFPKIIGSTTDVDVSRPSPFDEPINNGIVVGS